jgi:4-amino-4-deoxy-L-arabinose transferase-like glycosyltransferase
LSRAPRERSSRHLAIALLIVAAGALLRATIASLLPIFEAESYYWLWSRELAWGYFDHPPMVALAMSLSPILDDSPLGLRLGHLLLSTFGSLLFYALCLRWLTPVAALASLLALQFLPFWMPFGVAATPDGPLLAFWCLALLAFEAAVSRGGAARWLAAGVATGLTLLSKYNGALLLPAFFAFLLLDREGRRRLRTPGPWLALAVAIAIFFPNQLWNWTHGSDANLRPFHAGLELAKAPEQLVAFAALPFILLTPLLAWAWIRQSWVGIRSGRLSTDRGFRLAACASWLPLSAFAVVAIVTEIHAQWIVPCLVTALPLALENLGGTGAGLSPRFLRGALASAAVLVVAALGAVAIASFFASHEGPGRPRGIARLAVEPRGWTELGERVEAEIAERANGRPVVLTAPTHHLAARLEWLVRGRHPSHTIDPARANQYWLWRRDRDFAGWEALFVDKYASESDLRLLEQACGSVERLAPVTTSLGGAPFVRFTLTWCHDFRPLP